MDRETDPNYIKRKNVTWLCLCECGNFRHATTHELTHGIIRHCGCERNVKIPKLDGERFGKLTVIKPSRKANGRFAWKCQCDCGKFALIETSHLKSGKQTDCGCEWRKRRKENAKKG